MLPLLKTWLKPPQYEDTVQNRRATQLHILLWLLLIALSIYIPVIIFITGNFFSAIGLVTTGFALVVILLLFALHQGFVRLTASVLIIACWLGATIGTGFAGGWHESTAVSYTIIILISALLLSDISMIVLTILTIIAIIGFAYAEATGIIVPPPRPLATAVVDIISNFVVAVIFIYLIKNNLKQALHQAQQSNRQLSALSTHLENQVKERTQAATKAQAIAEAAQQEIVAQMWLTTGQARLSEVMRGEQDIFTLAHNIIQQLCRYLQVPTGVLFIKEEERLFSAGHYGLATSTNKTTFALGEGLVGEAALQRQMLTLSNLPNHYFNAASDQAVPPPRYILLLPFLYNGQVIGLIELGDEQPFSPSQQKLLKNVTESIAIAFYTAQTRTRIDTLVTQNTFFREAQ